MTVSKNSNNLVNPEEGEESDSQSYHILKLDEKDERKHHQEA